MCAIVFPGDIANGIMLRSTTQLRLSSEVGPFQGKDYRILIKSDQNRVTVEGGNLLQNDKIFPLKMDLLTRKNIFSPKCLFFPKTYVNSSIHTKYECLTRKTERDSFKIQSEIPSISLFSFVSHTETSFSEK